MPSPRAQTVLALLLLTPGLFLSGADAFAQVEHGGTPPSQHSALHRATPTARMRPVRGDLLLAEDAQAEKGALRFAEMLEVDLSLGNSGVWEELGNGDRTWRLRIESPGAYSLTLVFSRFQLPEGGELYVYDDRRQTLRGAYTELENRLDGEFAIRPTRGQALTLEYYEPARMRGRGELALASVGHDYRDVLGLLETTDRAGPGVGSDSCEINVACALGVPWPNQINATVHVLSPDGLLCSGSLLNNTANDGTILLLTAAHCGSLTNGLFTFNYQRPACRSGVAPCTNTVSGATRLIIDDVLDVQLLRLNAPQGPLGFPVYVAGWDRSDVAPASSVIIHHPGGDVKKISVDDDPPAKLDNFWRILDWEFGVTEGGSSGAPMFDPAGRFVGSLDSGASSCPVPSDDDFSTRLAAIWPRVEPYLDPLGTGQLTMDGLDMAGVTARPFDVTGVFPSAIESLYPGTARPVRILGSGFTNAAQLAIDGIPTARFVSSGYSWLNVDMPQLALGPHSFTVLENSVTKSVPFTVVSPPGPRLQVAMGDVGDKVFSSTGVNLIHADQPGHVHYCFWSFSKVPSLSPVWALGIGNNFTQLSGCLIKPIPAAGSLLVHHPIGNLGVPFGTPVYAQTICVNHHSGLPFPTSNLQESTFQF